MDLHNENYLYAYEVIKIPVTSINLCGRVADVDISERISISLNEQW